MGQPGSITAGRGPGGVHVLSLLLALGLLVGGYVFRADLGRFLTLTGEVVKALGPAAPLGMAVVCGVWGILCLPGPLMQGTVAALFAADPPVALAVVMAGETIAMTCGFLIGRSVGRERVRERMAGQVWFARLEDETRRRGFYGVLVFRLMPFFPNALASYAFGLTNLRPVGYLLASVIGSFPKMVLYIYGTTSVLNLIRTGVMSPYTLVGLAGLLAATYLLARYRRAAFKA